METKDTTGQAVELMKPRYKVIASYPHMAQDQHGVGDIISPYGMGFLFPEKVKEMYDTYPHLFKPLQWWEERKPEEMPEYVKPNEQGKLPGVTHPLKVVEYFSTDKEMFSCEEFPGAPMDTEDYEPATEAEYNTYKNNL